MVLPSLGRSIPSDKTFVGIAGGRVILARAIIRMVPEARWDTERLRSLVDTPLTEATHFVGEIETLENPHAPPESDLQEPPDALPARRCVRITLKYRHEQGLSHGCARCGLHQLNRRQRARFHHHTEACTQRLRDCLRKAKAPQIVHADADKTNPSGPGGTTSSGPAATSRRGILKSPPRTEEEERASTTMTISNEYLTAISKMTSTAP